MTAAAAILGAACLWLFALALARYQRRQVQGLVRALELADAERARLALELDRCREAELTLRRILAP